MKKLDVLAGVLVVVGAAAVYEIVQWPAMRRRWSRTPAHAAA